jgi:hypothetical protein
VSAAEAQSQAACDTAGNRERWYFSHRECPSRTTQVALLANVSQGEVEGSQLSLLANVAMEDVRRFQVAGVFNYGKRVRGVQLAGDVNLAQRVDGWQLGGVNIADTVKGGQVGSINIARELDGYGIGFLTLARNGLLHLDALSDETGMARLRFASGKTLFTSYSIGYTPDSPTHPYSFGIGFGYHKAFGRAYFEGELHGSLILDEDTRLEDLEDKGRKPGDSDWRHNSLFQVGLRLGRELAPNLGLFGGATLNALATHENERLLHPWSDAFTETFDEGYFWPGLEIGIRWGR